MYNTQNRTFIKKYLVDEINFYLPSFIHKNMYKIARTFAVY